MTRIVLLALGFGAGPFRINKTRNSLIQSDFTYSSRSLRRRAMLPGNRRRIPRSGGVRRLRLEVLSECPDRLANVPEALGRGTGSVVA
jgi:hypothetical protein